MDSIKSELAVVVTSIGDQGLLGECRGDGWSTSLRSPRPETSSLPCDSYRKKVLFNYEKRIRMQSPPEKIFEYFASFYNPDEEVFMLLVDLMRVIVPVFPPSESDIVKGGNLRGDHHPGELCCAPSEFFLLFDTNNDGLISFPKYIFFVTLLSIPESSFSVAFKIFSLIIMAL
ncbi:calcium uptake protein, mitochondrial-like [Iris pallida]|uniref:Calcium uptake protein, mitochondrial-like n=1 Tax=Iris pallida TaxID=29817 RepID=A0AAX6HBH1_IRIPA|nr:calcium uptake protein, mitochondrial-like [Iris pallida]